MNGQTEAICQSCAMPLSADPLGGGTEADGTRSGDYCSYCYRDGEFTDTTLTIEGMIARLRPLTESMGVPADAAAKAANALPYLKRWRESQPRNTDRVG